MSARVLVVCTANVCRSPMAAALLGRHLDAAGVDAQVTSAGTRRVDLPVDPDAVRALGELGIDLSAHRPRQIDRSVLSSDGADLVLTMTREQLRTVATTGPGVFNRAFTVRELARRATGCVGEQTWAGWLAAIGEGRRATDLLGDDPADDVSDPYGLGRHRVRDVADELDRLTATITRLVPFGAA